MWFRGSVVEAYLEDPFLAEIAREIEACGAIRPAVVDLTHVCNLRCKGCYFFAEEMDLFKSPDAEDEFDAFVRAEKERGTNYLTVVGGEPALQMTRLKKLHDNFRILPFTNGMIRIPKAGFEDLTIAISLWGGHETDQMLRGRGRIDVFARALRNYKDDPRVVWYYTTTPGNANEIAPVAEEIVANGNLLTFSFYEDHANLGDRFDHRNGFQRVRDEIMVAVNRYPDRILTTDYLVDVATTNRLYDLTWGHDVCPAVSGDNHRNLLRIEKPYPYSRHMRAYLPDLKTTRRCPVGDEHDCSACFNVLAKMTWIMINYERHLGTHQEFTRWLAASYVYHTFTGVISRQRAAGKLRRLQQVSASAPPVRAGRTRPRSDVDGPWR